MTAETIHKHQKTEHAWKADILGPSKSAPRNTRSLSGLVCQRYNRSTVETCWPALFETDPPELGISLAKTSSDLRAIGKLRYSNYIKGEKKQYSHADEEFGLFLDEVDLRSIQLFSSIHHRVVAAVRMTWAKDSGSDPQLMQLSNVLDVSQSKLVLCSRFAVEPSTAARVRIAYLFRALYRIGLHFEAQYCALSTSDKLVPLFEKFGFVTAGQSYTDPTVGKLQPMLLNAHDRNHLECKGSPYVKVLNELSENGVGRREMLPFDQLLQSVETAQSRFAALLSAHLNLQPTTLEQYTRYLSMEYHLTQGVQRYFITAAAHHDLSRRRKLREFLIKFANEEELHYLVAGNDLHQLGTHPLSIPFDVELWHAYFEKIVVDRPFVRLGAACILENISAGVAKEWTKKALQGSFLTEKNTKFLVLHQHEVLPHGTQILEALRNANLEERHWEDLIEGAKKGTVLYLRMAEWAIDPKCLSTLPDDIVLKSKLASVDTDAIASFKMADLSHAY